MAFEADRSSAKTDAALAEAVQAKEEAQRAARAVSSCLLLLWVCSYRCDSSDLQHLHLLHHLLHLHLHHALEVQQLYAEPTVGRTLLAVCCNEGLARFCVKLVG